MVNKDDNSCETCVSKELNDVELWSLCRSMFVPGYTYI